MSRIRKSSASAAAISLILGSAAPVWAQSFSWSAGGGTARPAISKDAAQDDSSAKPSPAPGRKVENVVDLSALQEPSDLSETAASGGGAAGLAGKLELISATYREPGAAAPKGDCNTVALSVGQRIKLHPEKVLEIVALEMEENSNCACDVVKAAIRASNADPGLTADIVETVITNAPETMRIASQCAIALVPESLTTIQALLAKLDANAGEGYSSKGSKGGKDAKGAEVLSASGRDGANGRNGLAGGPDPADPGITPPRVDPGNPLDIVPPSSPGQIIPPLIISDEVTVSDFSDGSGE